MLNAFYFCDHKQFYFTFTQKIRWQNSGQVFFLVCCIDSQLSSLGGFTFKCLWTVVHAAAYIWSSLWVMVLSEVIRGFTQKRNIKNKIHFLIFTLQPPDVVHCILMHFSSVSSPQKLKQLKFLNDYDIWGTAKNILTAKMLTAFSGFAQPLKVSVKCGRSCDANPVVSCLTQQLDLYRCCIRISKVISKLLSLTLKCLRLQETPVNLITYMGGFNVNEKKKHSVTEIQECRCVDSSLALSLRTVHRGVGGQILGAGAGSRGQDFLKVAFGLRSTNLCLSSFTGKESTQ